MYVVVNLITKAVLTAPQGDPLVWACKELARDREVIAQALTSQAHDVQHLKAAPTNYQVAPWYP